MINKLGGLVALCLLSGCATIPEQIEVSQEQKLINFNEVSEQAVGEPVRWGGVITGVTEQNDIAHVTVIQYPLLDSGQPSYASGSGGRFTAKLPTSMNIDHLEQGTVLTLIGKVEELQNPYPDLRTTQLAIVQADDFYVWNGFSSAAAPLIQNDHPAFIKRGKWGWQVKSDKEQKRERQERLNPIKRQN